MDSLKKYDKYKNNTLATPVYDEEREVLEYVWNLNDRLNIYNNISDFMGDTSNAFLYYPFIARTMIKGYDAVTHSHEHTFEMVLRELYKYPEAFRILKKDQKYYSSQELKYLNRVKKYLLFLGLKDVDSGKKIPAKRYQNKVINKYSKCYIYTIDKKEKELIKKGKLDFLWWSYYSYYKNENKSYKPLEYQALLVDEKDNFLYYIEFIDSRVVKYKDIKNIVIIDKKKDNTKVVIRHFKILERY